MLPGSLCKEHLHLDALNFHLNLRVMLLLGWVSYITAIYMQQPGCSVSFQWIGCISPWMLTGKMKYDTLVGCGIWFCSVCSVLNFVLCCICVAEHVEYVSLCADRKKKKVEAVRGQSELVGFRAQEYVTFRALDPPVQSSMCQPGKWQSQLCSWLPEIFSPLKDVGPRLDITIRAIIGKFQRFGMGKGDRSEADTES